MRSGEETIVETANLENMWCHRKINDIRHIHGCGDRNPHVAVCATCMF